MTAGCLDAIFVDLIVFCEDIDTLRVTWMIVSLWDVAVEDVKEVVARRYQALAFREALAK